jgi:hypothetical protein
VASATPPARLERILLPAGDEGPMGGNDQVLAIAGRLGEALPGTGLSIPAPVPWPTRREALRAALAVACFVGAPALAAVGAALALFALSAVVLLAPLVAAALTWAAWHCNRLGSEPSARGAAEERSGTGSAEVGGGEDLTSTSPVPERRAR